ncbi:MAG: Hsp20/alpha crystallin family protein [Bacteroidota bacterium]
MALIKYNRPNIDVFNRSFNDIFDEFFTTPAVSRKTSRFVPSVDISETDSSFDLAVQVPGLKKDDISIDLENGRLTISGERTLNKDEKGKNYHRVESSYGSFSRSFYLPDTIDEDTVKATYEDGILNITIKKAESKAKKLIKIS